MPFITRPAALVRQGSLKLYATSLTVRDLSVTDFYRIDKLDPAGSGQGFQRLLNQGRARRLTEYLLDGHKEADAFLPTSIFLATQHGIAFDPATNMINFDVAAVGPFNVVDGQHRIAGLVGAAEREPELLDFEVPVNIAVKLDDVSQMCHFLIVNTTQKSVDAAIEQQIVARLTDMLSVKNMPTIPRWILRQVEKGEDASALTIANHLNNDLQSPWRGKIRMANDDGGADATINQKSFVNSLKTYILVPSNPISSPTLATIRNQILANYWTAIVDLLVDPDATVSSVIFKTNGVELFHIVSPTVFIHLANKKKFTVDSIKQLLSTAFQNLEGESAGLAAPEWWQRGGVASGLNRAATRKFANALSQAINVQSDQAGIEL